MVGHVAVRGHPFVAVVLVEVLAYVVVLEVGLAVLVGNFDALEGDSNLDEDRAAFLPEDLGTFVDVVADRLVGLAAFQVSKDQKALAVHSIVLDFGNEEVLVAMVDPVLDALGDLAFVAALDPVGALAAYVAVVRPYSAALVSNVPAAYSDSSYVVDVLAAVLGVALVRPYLAVLALVDHFVAVVQDGFSVGSQIDSMLVSLASSQ